MRCALRAICPRAELGLALGFGVVQDSRQQKGVLCPAHAALRSQPQLSGEIATHRMVDTLTESGYCGLQVQLTGFEPRWQPACTVRLDVLQA